jgi:TonB family protein
MLELNPRPTGGTPRVQAVADSKQPRKLLLALVLLLVALAGLLVKDRQFWFGSDQSSLDSDGTEPAIAARPVAKSVATAARTQPTPAPAAKKQIPAGKNSAGAKPADDSPVVAATRTVLPPLDVEVVAGDAHRKIHPGSNATKVEIPRPGSEATDDSAAATNAAERERISAGEIQAPGPSEQTSYPRLAQQMKVQGSVVLQAVIGADGVIENLRVLSGAHILTSAAEQAVREWRFKPVVQNGQAVETTARITVNFTIKVADGSTKTTLAESRTSDNLIITR